MKWFKSLGFVCLALCCLSTAAYAADKITVGYYANWSAYHGYKPHQIPVDSLDVINYAFGNICYPGSTQKGCEKTTQCQVAFSDPGIDKQNFAALAKVKAKTKVVYSVGGWNNSNGFYHCAQTPAKRQQLADSIKSFLQQHPVLDGVDLDWEFPVKGGCADASCNNGVQQHSAQDKQNYADLLKVIRQAIGKDYLLTVAGPPADKGASQISDMPLAAIYEYTNYVNVMAYDYHGAWDRQTNFIAPLYADGANNQQTNIDSALQAYQQGGVPADKIVLGIPFYGIGFKLASVSGNGLYQAAQPLTTPKPDAGANFSYKLIFDTFLKSATDQIKWNNNSQTSYYLGKDNVFLSFVGPKDIKVRADYIKQNSLKGAMYWELSQDTCGKNSLSYQMSAALERSKSQVPACLPKVEKYSLELDNLSKDYQVVITIADGDKWYKFDDPLEPKGKGISDKVYTTENSSNISNLLGKRGLKVLVDFAGKQLWCNHAAGAASQPEASSFNFSANMHIMVRPYGGPSVGGYHLACTFSILPKK